MSKKPYFFSASLENITIFFSAVLLLTVGLIFYFTGEERIKEYNEYHQEISKKATHNTGLEITNRINNKRILVNNFIQDNINIIGELARSPSNIELYSSLDKKIQKYFIDYFSFSIASNNGDMLIDDFDGKVGERCITDTKDFVKNNRQKIRIHPNHDAYHFDILTRFKFDNKNYIFFVSFNADEIATLLRVSSPANHNLLVRFKEMQDLIEITSTGSRNSIKDRQDFRMTPDEKSRLLSSYKIPGSVWDVIDIHSPGLFSDYKNAIILRNTIIYVFFIIMTLGMSIVMIIEMRKRASVEKSLVIKNNEIEKLNTELAKLSITDCLTGLYNRRYMDIHAENEWNRSKRTNTPLHIALIDLDNFKQYNDSNGHIAGDKCLEIVGNLLSGSFRRNNEFVARYGGEEFIVFCSCDSDEDILQRLNEVASCVSKENMNPEQQDNERYVTISAGIASSKQAGIDSLEELIQAADSALYEAKAAGRNRVVMKEWR